MLRYDKRVGQYFVKNQQIHLQNELIRKTIFAEEVCGVVIGKFGLLDIILKRPRSIEKGKGLKS